MTANDESLHGTVQSDGTTGGFDSVTVPDDEVWYIDSLHLISDGSGSSASTVLNMKVGDMSVLNATDGTQMSGGRNVAVGVASDTIEAQESTIDAYAGGGEIIRVGKSVDGDTGATFSYTLTIRRIA